MKYLIVNGDDFGASYGVNRGIIEAHQFGILTSASLLVDSRWSEDAAVLSRSVPNLSVGWHVDLPAEIRASNLNALCLRQILHDQLSSFEKLLGQYPTHLD